MFGKVVGTWLPVVVLIGFFVYILNVFFEGTINLYVHPRYTVFSVGMASVALVLLLAGIRYITYKSTSAVRVPDIIAAIVLVLALALPAQALSEQTTGRKSMIVPTGSPKLVGTDTECPSDTDITKIVIGVTYLNTYPTYCFNRSSVNMTGFVVDPKDEPLPDGYVYVGRIVLACCTVDATPYAIAVEDTGGKLSGDGWVNVQGKLETRSINGQGRFVIIPSKITPTNEPAQPYEYL